MQKFDRNEKKKMKKHFYMTNFYHIFFAIFETWTENDLSNEFKIFISHFDNMQIIVCYWILSIC